MSVEINGEQVESIIATFRGVAETLIRGAAVNSAVILNVTRQPVTFYAYNYIDVLYAVDAQHTLLAPGRHGTVAASGNRFKVHPNKNADEQFLVEPGHAYIYRGPGDIDEV